MFPDRCRAAEGQQRNRTSRMDCACPGSRARTRRPFDTHLSGPPEYPILGHLSCGPKQLGMVDNLFEGYDRPDKTVIFL